jgi:hypothetical protein
MIADTFIKRPITAIVISLVLSHCRNIGYTKPAY